MNYGNTIRQKGIIPFSKMVNNYFLIDNIYVRYGKTVYGKVVGVPMGINCAPLISDLFMYCYELQFMVVLTKMSSKVSFK